MLLQLLPTVLLLLQNIEVKGETEEKRDVWGAEIPLKCFLGITKRGRHL